MTNRGQGEATAAVPGLGPATRAVHNSPDIVADVALTVFHPSATSVEAGFFTWDISSGEVICDPVTFRMHGLSDGLVATMDTFLGRVPDSDLHQVREAMRTMVAAAGTYQIEYRIRAEDGGLRWMEARGRVMPGPDGRPARMMGLVMDTTAARERREAEERQLREVANRASRARDFTAALASASTVNAIIEAASDGLHAYGANGVILMALRDGRLQVVASCGFEQASVHALSGLDPAHPTPLSVAIQWRFPVYLPSRDSLADDFPHLAEILAGSAQQAWAALPVVDSAGKVGGCLFGFPEPHDFSHEERTLLFAASGLLSQSMERAQMHQTQHALATELQRGMLPRGPLTAPGLSIATRYQAATSGIEIGGDFYDVVTYADGEIALVIGDVQGHNLLAASLMGRLRTAVHAYTREGHGPAEVMARTNRWLADLNTDPEIALFATCCFVVVNPATGEVKISRAGHPPPVLVPPGARPRILDCDAGLPLGIDPAADYSVTKLTADAGAVLVLTTDGLLESDSGDDFNLSRLLDVLSISQADDLDELANDLLNSIQRSRRHGDDVALLLARIDDVKQVN
ncbi:MAG TPA: SpoIIE family protein phosphatase [Streptosporangiaceae bacterium]|nr:SpoIIE family protein phosphatase [Streptosporangiaceae bacterium]